MSLYQKYRPKNFSDVVGQSFVKELLANSCRSRTFHHGYIFFGFHGIGKTTLARIFSQAVNCTNITPEGNPCHECANCLSYNAGKMIDVIEIDAASHTSVDNIREVIDHAKFTPTQGTYKIYIIDEVHMLSKGAFNALLKTLEEPPAHVIFLLATTEIHKVPDTILSRVIRFDLERIGEKDMSDLLEKISTEEGIKYEPEALKMIINRSRGSMRDAITMLEKCIYENTLTAEYVGKALHLVNQGFIRETVEACISGDAKQIEHVHTTLRENSTDVRQFATQVTEWIVENLEEALKGGKFREFKEVFDLFTQVFIQSRLVSVPMDILTMALFGRIKTGVIVKDQEQKVDHKKTEKVTAVEPIMPEVVEKKIETTKINTESNNKGFSPAEFIERAIAVGIKQTILPTLRTTKKISLGDGIITIEAKAFEKKKYEDQSVMPLLQEVAKSYDATIEIVEVSTEESPETDIADMAASIFS